MINNRMEIKLSPQSIERLAEIITGDAKISQYRTESAIHAFLINLNLDDAGVEPGSSRKRNVENYVKFFNSTKHLEEIILAAIDERDFVGTTEFNLEKVVGYLNEMFSYDNCEIILRNDKYVVHKRETGKVLSTLSKDDVLSDEYINEQVEKCQEKISTGDFDGAITNARTLIEAVLQKIDKKSSDSPKESSDSPHSKNEKLPQLYKKVQGNLNLAPGNDSLNQDLKQILSGLTSIVSGVAAVRNTASDSHKRRYNPKEHHAVLVVNTAMTFCRFLFDTYSYQKSKNEENK